MAKSYDVFGRCTRRELLALEASEILGCSERQFRRYRQRYEEGGSKAWSISGWAAGGRDRLDAGAVPGSSPGLDGEALSRALAGPAYALQF